MAIYLTNSSLDLPQTSSWAFSIDASLCGKAVQSEEMCEVTFFLDSSLVLGNLYEATTSLTSDGPNEDYHVYLVGAVSSPAPVFDAANVDL